MKTAAKGGRWELRVKKLLESSGYSVEKVRVTFSKKDYFNCADILASNPKEFKLIAVTSKHNISRARKKLKGFTNHPKFIKKEVWHYNKEGIIGTEEV